jgi:hypothetical protein
VSKEFLFHSGSGSQSSLHSDTNSLDRSMIVDYTVLLKFKMYFVQTSEEKIIFAETIAANQATLDEFNTWDVETKELLLAKYEADLFEENNKLSRLMNEFNSNETNEEQSDAFAEYCHDTGLYVHILRIEYSEYLNEFLRLHW